jgi:hypothetical protein
MRNGDCERLRERKGKLNHNGDRRNEKKNSSTVKLIFSLNSVLPQILNKKLLRLTKSPNNDEIFSPPSTNNLLKKYGSPYNYNKRYKNENKKTVANES